MTKFVKVAQKNQIPNNSMKDLTVGDLEILLVNLDGKFYALQNKCPHLKYPLYLGTLRGNVLTCGFHYAKFDVTTGKVLSGPTKEDLKTFTTKTEGSDILVDVDSDN
ncbi:MAG: Rieske 2Fe-2S domain-containing protein [Candidatus Bathyarchaeota archaeon]|nr:Rieske 2Fe-2S domain-containing protein [Candidatus Bathyarchaeota archaeon]